MMLEIEKTLVKLLRNQISYVYNTPNLPKIVSKPMTLRFQKGRSAAPVWTISLMRKVENGHFFGFFTCVGNDKLVIWGEDI